MYCFEFFSSEKKTMTPIEMPIEFLSSASIFTPVSQVSTQSVKRFGRGKRRPGPRQSGSDLDSAGLMAWARPLPSGEQRGVTTRSKPKMYSPNCSPWLMKYLISLGRALNTNVQIDTAGVSLEISCSFFFLNTQEHFVF